MDEPGRKLVGFIEDQGVDTSLIQLDEKIPILITELVNHILIPKRNRELPDDQFSNRYF
jgi:hypothetical protein